MKLFADKRRMFPDPRQALDDGLLVMSDELTPEMLFEAYSFGIFPWPHDDPASPILWFCPNPRGILEFKDLHISTSLAKFKKNCGWQLKTNTAFAQVIADCATAKRSDGDGTWITDHMIKNYIEFHKMGYAHSFEVWDRQELVGGLYGVYVAGVFAGESMFYKKSNASKIALLSCIEYLQSHGHSWMDIQMVTPNLEAMGGKYIARDEFLKKLEQAKKKANSCLFT